MADISKINVNGQIYEIKDSVARSLAQNGSEGSVNLGKEYEINVLNPPSDTGLLPYVFNGDVTANTQRVQAMLDYIGQHEKNYMESGMSLYTGYNYTIVFPTGTYVFNTQLEFKGHYLTILGRRAIIQTTHNNSAFHFADGAGWFTTIEGFTFDRVYNGIWFDFYNLEMGSTRILDCWFLDNQNEAIHINKQSLIGVVRDCRFHKCGYVLYFDNVDKMIFEGNWVSEKPRWKNKDASIIAKSMRLLCQDNLWVPYPAESGVTESAYINAHCTVRCFNNLFGGEVGSKPVMNVMCQFDYTNKLILPVIEVSDSEALWCIQDYTVLRLFALPAGIIVKGNYGFADNQVVAKWGNGVDTSTAITKVDDMLQIDISMNGGFRTTRANGENGIYLIPTELNRFLYNFNKFNN